MCSCNVNTFPVYMFFKVSSIRIQNDVDRNSDSRDQNYFCLNISNIYQIMNRVYNIKTVWASLITLVYNKFSNKIFVLFYSSNLYIDKNWIIFKILIYRH